MQFLKLSCLFLVVMSANVLVTGNPISMETREVQATCKKTNWWSSFDKKGWSTCENNKLFINGFYRSALGSWNRDEIYRLEEANCCPSSSLYLTQSSECKDANWWASFDKTGWSVCPSGYFLNGLYRTSGNNLHNIEAGRCCKPSHHPDKYADCYDENVMHEFDKAGWSTCKKDGYYVVGAYRNSHDWLYDIDYFKCCKMETEVQPTCNDASWWSSFDKKGWSKCGDDKLFITGFYRSALGSWSRDEIYRLESARCCSTNSPLYVGENSVCKSANWWASFDKTGWSVCPSGYFLNGLYRTSGNNLHNIEEGHCCKPVSHPDRYGECYDENVTHEFDKAGWTTCKKAGYYVVGAYRNSHDWLYDIDYFKCCQMATGAR